MTTISLILAGIVTRACHAGYSQIHQDLAHRSRQSIREACQLWFGVVNKRQSISDYVRTKLVTGSADLHASYQMRMRLAGSRLEECANLILIAETQARDMSFWSTAPFDLSMRSFHANLAKAEVALNLATAFANWIELEIIQKKVGVHFQSMKTALARVDPQKLDLEDTSQLDDCRHIQTCGYNVFCNAFAWQHSCKNYIQQLQTENRGDYASFEDGNTHHSSEYVLAREQIQTLSEQADAACEDLAEYLPIAESLANINLEGST